MTTKRVCFERSVAFVASCQHWQKGKIFQEYLLHSRSLFYSTRIEAGEWRTVEIGYEHETFSFTSKYALKLMLPVRFGE